MRLKSEQYFLVLKLLNSRRDRCAFRSIALFACLTFFLPDTYTSSGKLWNKVGYSGVKGIQTAC